MDPNTNAMRILLSLSAVLKISAKPESSARDYEFPGKEGFSFGMVIDTIAIPSTLDEVQSNQFAQFLTNGTVIEAGAALDFSNMELFPPPRGARRFLPEMVSLHSCVAMQCYEWK